MDDRATAPEPRPEGWLERRRRRAVAWWGARFRRLPPPATSFVGVFCDLEGHYADRAGEACAERGLDVLLNLLDEVGSRITFNAVADLCRSRPRRIRRIAERGHEIACHGWRHERPRDLPAPAVEAMLDEASRCFADLGIRPIGFRSPQSAWSVALLDELAAHGYRWNAEHDPSPLSYIIRPGLVRIPVATDDWDLVDGTCGVEDLIRKWRRHVGRVLPPTSGCQKDRICLDLPAPVSMVQRPDSVGSQPLPYGRGSDQNPRPRSNHLVCLGLHEWIVGRDDAFATALRAFLVSLRSEHGLQISTLGAIAGCDTTSDLPDPKSS